MKTYIGSNQEQHRAEYIRVKLGLKDFFHETYFSHSLESKKPDADFFNKIFVLIRKKINKIKKDEILFVDDQEGNTESARTLGFKAHHYKSLNLLKKEIAHLVGA